MNRVTVCSAAIFCLVAILSSAQGQSEQCGQLDICFLVDSSGSIRDNNPGPPSNRDNWLTILEFVVQIIDNSKVIIGPTNTQVGLITFGNNAQQRFYLNAYTNKIELSQAVLATSYIGGTTNTMEAFRMARTSCFNTNNGDRDYAPNVVIIITDGLPTAYIDPSGQGTDWTINFGNDTYARLSAIEEAQDLKDTGAIVIAVGVTQLIDEAFLAAISSAPHIRDQNYFPTVDFEQLTLNLQPLLETACTVTTPVPRPTTTRSSCSRVDLCLLVDSSGSIRDANPRDNAYDNWRLMLLFLSAIIRELDIGPQATQVGLVYFSDRAYEGFGLGTLQTSGDVIDAIMATPYLGSWTATGEAFDLVRTSCLHGVNDRINAPNVVMILTDGVPTLPEPADRARGNALAAAQRLKDTGAMIYAIGITNNIDSQLLMGFSSPPQIVNRNYFFSPDFSQLQPLVGSLVSETCNVVEGPSTDCRARVDLGFVLDMSESIVFHSRANWDLVKNFSADVALAFPISPTLTRVGVVKFSDTAYLEFNLDAHMQPDDLKRAILNIQRTGTDTNIASALRVMRTQLYNSRGDREDAKNIVFFLTDGIANIDAGRIDEEARLCREAGIDIFAIGVTSQVSTVQLNQIASSPHGNHGDHVFLVDDFDRLQDILNIIINEACEIAPTVPEIIPTTTTPMTTTTRAPTTTTTRTTTTTLRPSTGCNGDNVDVLFLLDSSGSIGEPNFQKIRDFVINVITELSVDNGRVRVAITRFSDNVQTIFDLDDYSNRGAMVSVVRNLRYVSGTTNTAAALQQARTDIFQSSRGDRANALNLAIVITDGESSDPTATMREARALKAANVHVMSVAIGNWLNIYELQAIASYPVDRNLIRVNNFDALNNILYTVRDAVCDNDNECRNNPCRRGSCRDYIRYYLCDCPTGYGGTNCDINCRQGADIVFALDTSGSVGPENFRKMVDFLITVCERLDLDHYSSSTQGMRVGVVSYSTNTYLQFYLNAYTNKRDLLNGLMLRYRGGSTNTADVIRYARDSMFTLDHGDRSNVPNILVIMTDGRSNQPEQTWQEAVRTRNAGIHIIALGIGSGVDERELEAMASAPTSTNVLTTTSFNNLNNLIGTLSNSLCNNQNECSSNPCQNGAQCIDMINGYSCGPCPPGTTGNNCERRCTNQADVAFVIDSSGSIRHERFPLVLKFVKTVIEQLEVRLDATRIGLLYWSSNAALGFHLNQYDSKQDVCQAVLRTPFMGERTFTSQAIDMLRSQVFNGRDGDRPDVPNYAIIVTDGNSNINPERTIPAAIQARVEGVQFIVVSVGTDVNMIELEGIASAPTSSNIYAVNSINNLPGITSQIVSSVCDTENECRSNPCRNGGRCVDQIKRYTCTCQPGFTGYNCERRCSRQYDVSLILDLSGSMDQEYRMTIDFAKAIVYGLDMTLDRVRVSALAYSDNVFSVFYLNAYQSQKEGVINALNYYHHGGRTNTQSALSTSRNEVFTTNNGDRSGVQNLAIVISDGDSNVNEGNTIPEADRMRNQAIRVFSVATGDSPDLAEMNGIANNPDSEYVYRLRNLGDVNAVADRLLNYIC